MVMLMLIIKKTNKLIEIEFTVNCGRYGKHDDNYIKISNRGDVRMGLSEIIEGGDLDFELKESIERLIK